MFFNREILMLFKCTAMVMAMKEFWRKRAMFMAGCFYACLAFGTAWGNGEA